MICRHCHEGSVSRPRGLCWTCYYKPGVRELYPGPSKFARRGIGNDTGFQSLPEYATKAIPGTAEKLAVLQKRALLRQNLWHPDDAPLPSLPVLLAQAG